MKIQGIYKIVNKINNKIYIGQSINIEERFKQHKRSLNKYFKYPLYNAFRKYGIENFEFVVLEWIKNRYDLNEREQYWLDYYQSYNKDFGYNIALGAKGNVCAQETRDKISIANKGKRKGCKLSEEHNRKNCDSHKGIKQSEDTINKIKLSNKKYWNIQENRNKHSIILKNCFNKSHFNKGHIFGIKTQFKKGNIPWNKGLKINSKLKEMC